MSEPSALQSASEFPRERLRGWRFWRAPLLWTVMFVYGAQVVPFVAGSLSECDHCVATYLRTFAFVPGVLLGHWLVSLIPGASFGSDLVRFIAPGIAMTICLLAAATVITASTRRAIQVFWLALLATLSAFNALAFCALLRA